MSRLSYRCPLLLGCFFALLFFLPANSRAQQAIEKPELPFSLLSIDDGLSQGMVNCIAQDHFGFLWFGTKDGLNRYDGLRFNVYRNNPEEAGSLSDNYIQAIFEDSKKRMWIGSSSEGVELFNRDTETFHHFRLDSGSNSLSNCVLKIQEDKDQNLWIGTMNGLFKLTFEEEGPVRGKNEAPKVSIKKYFEKACNFQITRKGTIYGTATWHFPFVIKPEKNGNDQIEILNAETHYWAPSGITDLLKFNSRVVEDSLRKKVYFLYEYSFVEVDLETKIAKTVFRRSRESATLPFNALIDKEGLLWITSSSFIEQFNPRSGKIKIITAKDADLKQAASQVRSIYACKSGILWFGTMGFGILKYNPALQKFNHVSGHSMGWMRPGNNGNIIAQVPGAFLSELNPQSGEIRIIVSDSLYSSKMGMPLIRPTYAAAQDREGLYWVIRENLVRYDHKTATFDTIGGQGVSGVPLYVASTGEIWFGTLKAFSCFNPKTGKIRHWDYPFEITNDPYLFIQAIYHDTLNGLFWLGTNHGLLMFNPGKSSWKTYLKKSDDSNSLSNNIVFSILPDPKQPGRILWLGTNGGGLNKLDLSTGKFTIYTEHDGLPNNVVYGILSDNSFRLWLSTNRGLSRFNPADTTFRNFDARDGLQGNEFNRYAFCKDGNGILYFGGINGLNYFHPDAITDNPVKPDIVITGIKLKNKTVSFKSKNSPLSMPAYLEHKIEIPYDENMIAFEFAALEFSAPRKNLYQYRLNGFDKEWIQSGNTPSAIYTNLDPGEYTFMVRGSNSDGIWGEQEARISVIILTPWYLTWWFRISVLVLVAGGIYKLYRYRLNQTIRLQELRNRIASDLHDEIGSTLSSISLYGEAAKKMVSNNPDAMRMLTRINENTQQMMEAMSDIVWTINTRHDRFDEMMSRMREYAIQATEARNCEVHFNEVPEISQVSLDMNQRKNIYLIFKEAVNNAVKYSECTNLFVEFHFRKWGCIIKIRDDGKGFNVDQVKKGNGLYNMYKRTEVIKGDLSIHSEPGSGTEVVLKVLF